MANWLARWGAGERGRKRNCDPDRETKSHLHSCSSYSACMGKVLAIRVEHNCRDSYAVASPLTGSFYGKRKPLEQSFLAREQRGTCVYEITSGSDRIQRIEEMAAAIAVMAAFELLMSHFEQLASKLLGSSAAGSARKHPFLFFFSLPFTLYPSSAPPSCSVRY